MTSESKDMKDQRDRFLAFAFAGADLMIEVGRDGRILFALGAAKGMTGESDQTLAGMDVLEIFAPRDRGLVSSLRARAKPGLRFGPILVNLNDEKTSFRKAMLSGVAMPDRPGTVFLTLAKGSVSTLTDALAERSSSESTLLDKDTFTQAALDILAASDTLGLKLGMTLVDLPESKNFKSKLGNDRWQFFRENVSTLLRTYAPDGKTAGEFDEGKYGVVHNKSVGSDTIQKDIESLSRHADPDNQGIPAAIKEVDLHDDALSEHELAKAVTYTITQFERQGANFNIRSLESGFETYLTENAARIKEFKSVINQQRFTLRFQPVINLADGSVAYYETLVRFRDDDSPYESILFCEDVGLSPELDLAICGKVMNYIIYNAPDEKLRVAVNLSGLSVQNDRFVAKLRAKLEPHLKTSLPSRMIFEITESSKITQLDKVNDFVRALQDDGFKVSLDDFGAGSSSFQYLQKLHVDSVKIDGHYTSNIVSSERDRAMVNNLVRMCGDLKVSVVAERVETKEQALLLRQMGVDMGQGYFFAKPLTEPKFALKST